MGLFAAAWPIANLVCHTAVYLAEEARHHGFDLSRLDLSTITTPDSLLVAITVEDKRIAALQFTRPVLE